MVSIDIDKPESCDKCPFMWIDGATDTPECEILECLGVERYTKYVRDGKMAVDCPLC